MVNSMREAVRKRAQILLLATSRVKPGLVLSRQGQRQGSYGLRATAAACIQPSFLQHSGASKTGSQPRRSRTHQHTTHHTQVRHAQETPAAAAGRPVARCRSTAMDFDDHDDSDEEMAPMPMPVSSSYDAPPLAAGFGGGGVEPPSDLAKAPAGGLGAGRYRECLKNHAVGIGGHAVDGCGEFMPAGEEGTLGALRCAACGCHRNFHRKEPAAGSGSGSLVSPAALAAYGSAAPHHHHHFSPYCRTPAGYFHQQPLQMAPPVPVGHTPRPLALPSTSHGWRDDGDGDDDFSGMAGPLSAVGPLGGMSLGGTTGPSGSGGSGSGKKRFRTKFSQEQKDRMLAFAERVGWRVQKHDEAAVQQFCDEVCVKRHVLKVWMHNNKHTLGKKP